MYALDRNVLKATTLAPVRGNWAAKLGRELRDQVIHAVERRKILSEFKVLLGASESVLRDMGLTRGQVEDERARFLQTGMTNRPTRFGRL